MGEPIQNPLVGESLREFFRLVGGVRPELELGILGTVTVGDLSGSAPPVHRRHASAQGAQVAAAAQFAFFELSVLDPNTLAVITDVYAFSTAADDQLRLASSSGIVVGGTVHTARMTDARVRTTHALFAGGTPPAYVFQSASLAGGPIANNLAQGRWSMGAARNTLHVQPRGLVLLGRSAPSLASGVSFSNDVAAATLVMTVEWDEYQLP